MTAWSMVPNAAAFRETLSVLQIPHLKMHSDPEAAIDAKSSFQI
jgi:hypothetical protein